MNEFPKLETKRLFLKELEIDDVPKIVEYAGNRNISSNTQNIPHPYTREDAIFWIDRSATGFKERRQFTFAIKLKDTKEFIGGIGLRVDVLNKRAELGYWIAEPFWNCGFAAEATHAVLHFCFETLNLNKIFATHLEKNPASGKVMLKNNMIQEGKFKDHVYKDGHFHTLIQYRLTRSEFRTNFRKK